MHACVTAVTFGSKLESANRLFLKIKIQQFNKNGIELINVLKLIKLNTDKIPREKIPVKITSYEYYNDTTYWLSVGIGVRALFVLCSLYAIKVRVEYLAI